MKKNKILPAVMAVAGIAGAAAPALASCENDPQHSDKVTVTFSTSDEREGTVQKSLTIDTGALWKDVKNSIKITPDENCEFVKWVFADDSEPNPMLKREIEDGYRVGYDFNAMAVFKHSMRTLSVAIAPGFEEQGEIHGTGEFENIPKGTKWGEIVRQIQDLAVEAYAGYEIDKWVDNKGVTLTDDYEIKNDFTAYVQFKNIQETITLVPGIGGELVDPSAPTPTVTATYGDTWGDILPSIPTPDPQTGSPITPKPGFEFDGWAFAYDVDYEHKAGQIIPADFPIKSNFTAIAKFEQIKLNVNFHLGEEEFVTEVVAWGTEWRDVVRPAAPAAPTGQHFVDWSTSQTEYAPVGDDTEIQDNLDIYPYFEADEVTITFDAGEHAWFIDAEGNKSKQFIATPSYGDTWEDVAKPTVVVNEDYDYVEGETLWVDADGHQINDDDEIFDTFIAKPNLIVKQVHITFETLDRHGTLEFDSDDVEWGTKFGSAIPDVTEVTPGYEFTGKWIVDYDDDGKPIYMDVNAPIEGKEDSYRTFTAEIIPTKLSVTFIDAPHATVTQPESPVIVDFNSKWGDIDESKLPLVDVATGYEIDEEQPWINAKTLEPLLPDTNILADLVVQPYIKAKDVAMQYSCNIQDEAIATIEEGSSTTKYNTTWGELEQKPTCTIVDEDNYEFTGWFINGDETRPITDDTIITGDNDQNPFVATAVVKAKKHTITLTAGEGGTLVGGTKNIVVEEDGSWKIPSTDIPQTQTDRSHKFSKWVNSTTGEDIGDDDALANTSFSQDTIVTAEFESNTITVNFETNVDDDVVELSTTSLTDVPGKDPKWEDVKNRVSYTYLKGGYEFDGWFYTPEGGSETEIADNTELTDGMTITAKFHQTEITINWSADHGTITSAPTVHYGDVWSDVADQEFVIEDVQWGYIASVDHWAFKNEDGSIGQIIPDNYVVTEEISVVAILLPIDPEDITITFVNDNPDHGFITPAGSKIVTGIETWGEFKESTTVVAHAYPGYKIEGQDDTYEGWYYEDGDDKVYITDETELADGMQLHVNFVEDKFEAIEVSQDSEDLEEKTWAMSTQTSGFETVFENFKFTPDSTIAQKDDWASTDFSVDLTSDNGSVWSGKVVNLNLVDGEDYYTFDLLVKCENNTGITIDSFTKFTKVDFAVKYSEEKTETYTIENKLSLQYQQEPTFTGIDQYIELPRVIHFGDDDSYKFLSDEVQLLSMWTSDPSSGSTEGLLFVGGPNSWQQVSDITYLSAKQNCWIRIILSDSSMPQWEGTGIFYIKD